MGCGDGDDDVVVGMEMMNGMVWLSYSDVVVGLEMVAGRWMVWLPVRVCVRRHRRRPPICPRESPCMLAQPRPRHCRPSPKGMKGGRREGRSCEGGSGSKNVYAVRVDSDSLSQRHERFKAAASQLSSSLVVVC